MNANRVVYGRNSVQSHLKPKLTDRNRLLQEYFTVVNLKVEHFTIDKDTKVKTTFFHQKPSVYCHKIDEFLTYIFQTRNVSLNTHEIVWAFDGGQKFLKVCVNIVSKTTESVGGRYLYSQGVAPRTKKDSSVKRSIILAIMPDVKELYFNIASVMKFLITQFIVFPSNCIKFVADLKLTNIICGLQNHKSIFCCLYCEDCSPWIDSSSPRRSIGSLNEDYRNYVKAGSKLSKAMKFHNVVHPPLLRGDDSVPIIDIFVPPELHLFTGTVEVLISHLIDVTPGDFIIDFLK